MKCKHFWCIGEWYIECVYCLLKFEVKKLVLVLFLFSCGLAHADTYSKVCGLLEMCDGSRPKLVIVTEPMAQRAFYHQKTHTIYVRSDSVTEGVLAHEMAHAILDNYQAYTLSIRAQEIIAGYVEFEINKFNKKGEKYGRR